MSAVRRPDDRYSGGSRADGGAAAALAFLRAALLALILASEQLVDARQLSDWQFFAVLVVAAGYALAGLMVAVGALGRTGTRAFARVQPGCDVVILAALAYTSGGAFSDVRKAFFVVPLAAAFSERSRLTAAWSLLAVAAFTLQATVAGGHPAGAQNSWQRLTINQTCTSRGRGRRPRCWRSRYGGALPVSRGSPRAASVSSHKGSSPSNGSGPVWRARCTIHPCRT